MPAFLAIRIKKTVAHYHFTVLQSAKPLKKKSTDSSYLSGSGR